MESTSPTLSLEADPKNLPISPLTKQQRDRAYYLKTRERQIAKARAWNQANPERRRKISADWDKRHPTKAAARRQRREERIRQAPGRHTEEEWQQLLDIYQHRCGYCGCDIRADPCKDHIVALSRGGRNDIDNLLPACRGCNSSKRDRDVLDFIAALGARSSAPPGSCPISRPKPSTT